MSLSVRAEAEAIRQKGLAEAEAMKQKKQRHISSITMRLWLKCSSSVLPDIAKSVAQPLSSIDKVSIIGGDASGVSGVSGNVPILMAQTMQTVKEATGIDMGGNCPCQQHPGKDRPQHQHYDSM